jgi:hypothetical protein
MKNELSLQELELVVGGCGKGGGGGEEAPADDCATCAPAPACHGGHC